MDFNEALIDIVRENPVLWDIADKNHRNLELRKLKWEEIAHALFSDAETCRKRWKTLRDRFTRAEKDLKRPTGSGGEDVKKWNLLELLSFLRPTVAPRRTVSNFHASTTLLDLAGMANDEIMTEVTIGPTGTECTSISVDREESPVAVESPQATSTQASQVPHSSRNKSTRTSKRRNEEEDPLEIALKKRLLTSSPQKEYSSDELFFLSIAKDCSALSLHARMAFKAKTIIAMQEAMQADGNEPNTSRMFGVLQLLGRNLGSSWLRTKSWLKNEK